MMHAGLWQQLMRLDPKQTAQRALCHYCSGDDDKECYFVTLLNKQYKVDLTTSEIYLSDDVVVKCQANFLEQLCILTCLINAKNKPLTYKLVQAQALPGGDFFFRGIHELPIAKLAETFGRNAKKMYEVVGIFNGTKCDYGDASIRLQALPRIPITIIIWAAEEEFAARSSFLFDKSVADQLPLDALGVLADLTVAALVKAATGGESLGVR